ncbi:hypothetical protein OCGS_1815 [Oceaniovalibus guishaninsula JLT2003]|uniref:Hly-III family protein n=1 Tax=Oceaniovalibus guishaninsula JLT2003 TaxID=1231392 RepID=K2HN68_9RHOB|nr:hemolysin III family protein [Oceaniovalibus guishaninsula]EKE44299.1 hypothetical protein OCGS_1815 [Oceaniovalibus guishaninsula JLT2003]
MWKLDPRTTYSPAERFSDAVVHYIGVVLALSGVPVLVVLAVLLRGDWASITGIAVYGACLLAMLVCSALYNITHGGRWTALFRRLDHSAIYLKIAGTFTPLVALTGAAGLPLLAGLWGAALGGTSLKVWAPDRLRWLGLSIYLGMGWIGVFAGASVLDALSPAAWRLVVAGGLIYTLGVAFFLWDRLPFHTTIWHVFVLVATVLFYVAMTVEVVRVA